MLGETVWGDFLFCMGKLNLVRGNRKRVQVFFLDAKSYFLALILFFSRKKKISR